MTHNYFKGLQVWKLDNHQSFFPFSNPIDISCQMCILYPEGLFDYYSPHYCLDTHQFFELFSRVSKMSFSSKYISLSN